MKNTVSKDHDLYKKEDKVIYHVCSLKKFNMYMEHNLIKGPVRAWLNIEAAERFSKQTGRKIIIRIKLNKSFRPYEGHKGEAVISDDMYVLDSM